MNIIEDRVNTNPWFGEYGEHIHVYEWDKERGIPNRSPRELTVEERKENEDIL